MVLTEEKDVNNWVLESPRETRIGTTPDTVSRVDLSRLPFLLSFMSTYYSIEHLTPTFTYVCGRVRVCGEGTM